LLEFYFSKNFKGEGISEGIERGILVDYNNKCIVQEGMGLGSPAIKTNNGTFFSSNSELIEVSDKEYIKEFDINSELVWEIFKVRSEKYKSINLLTIFINKLTDLYKRLRVIQPILLKLGILTRDFFQTNSEINHIDSLGKIKFLYTILKDEVLIEVDFSQILKNNGKAISKICILNELGGEFFNYSKLGEKILAAPSGWEKIKGDTYKKLYSDKFNLEFDVKLLEYPHKCKIDFIVGREKLSNFCWAGFDIEININSDLLKSNLNNGKVKYICRLKAP
jgi:hypothetical protein